MLVLVADLLVSCWGDFHKCKLMPEEIDMHSCASFGKLPHLASKLDSYKVANFF